VLLEVLLGGSDELDASELEAAVLEAGDDGTNEAALWGLLVYILLTLLSTPPSIVFKIVVSLSH
jgi:hypothetical protein